MAESLDLDWFPFSLSDGQRLTLDVDWGEGGLGRAEAFLAVYDKSGALLHESLSGAQSWSGGPFTYSGENLWLGADSGDGFYAEFTWTADADGILNLDEVPILAEPAGQIWEALAEAAASTEGGLFAGGDLLYGGGIAIGDVLIGGAGKEGYRITSASEGDTVTILDFHPGEGGDVLDISDLLATGAGSIEVSYDSRSASTTLTVSGAGAGDTTIIVHGVDLTSDFDAYVVTDIVL